MEINQVAIIGAGPAGLSTALQLKRYAINPLLFEGNRIGGLLWNANLVENYPGFAGGISGPHLVERFIEQMNCVSNGVIPEQVKRLSFQDNLFHVITDQQDYLARLVVIASGTKPKLLTDCFIPEETRNKVFYEVFPLIQCRNCRIAVIGAGDAAFDYALNLAQYNEVIILNRGEEVKCLPLLWERANLSPNISYHSQLCLTSLENTESGKLALVFLGLAEKLAIQADYLLCATGREPQLAFMASFMPNEVEKLKKDGLLYFAGDVINEIYRQTAIAVGDGIMTAMKIYRQLREMEP